MDKQEEEIWKDIPGYEGYYKVSNFGSVKSVDRIVKFKNGHTHRVGKPMALIKSNRGYFSIKLHKDGTPHTFKVHQLVYLSFSDQRAHDPCYVVNHKDGNGLNNNISNLELVTQRENSSICFRKNRCSKTSKYTGVSWSNDRRKWVAQMKVNGRQVLLGRFECEMDAALAYIKGLHIHLKINTSNVENHLRLLRPQT